MNRVRRAFVDVQEVAVELVKAPEVAARWGEPSALAEWSVAGLAGHLVRATTAFEDYLEADPSPSGETVTPAYYYATAADPSDVNTEENRAIRARGDATAAGGHDALVRLHRAAADRMRDRLAIEPDDRRIKVFLDLVLKIDDYAAIRIVEATCHIDDLAVSVGLPTPEMPPDALDIAITTMLSVGRHRHGDLAVLRALARRERDQAQALRVF